LQLSKLRFWIVSWIASTTAGVYSITLPDSLKVIGLPSALFALFSAFMIRRCLRD